MQNGWYILINIVLIVINVVILIVFERILKVVLFSNKFSIRQIFEKAIIQKLK